MGALFVYIIKSSFCLAFFYLFYRLLLSKDTFHRFNRIALLGLILLSVVIPFIQFSVKEPVIMQQSLLDIEQLLLLATMTSEQVTVTTPLWISMVLWLYFLGALFFAGQFIYSCYNIYRIIHKAKMIRLEKGIRLFVTQQTVAPFSWMKFIVISQKDMDENGEEILTHEKAHIKAHHSIDLLIAEFCILFHWFNPAAWLIKQEMQNIHEYQADESVIKQGIDAKKYQLLLIKKAVGSQRFTSMANSFNHSTLKKRITMMLKRKSSPWARLKYLFVLPLAVVTITVFARPEISQELGKISSVKINQIVPISETIEVETLHSVTEPIDSELVANDTVVITLSPEWKKNQPEEKNKIVKKIVEEIKIVTEDEIVIKTAEPDKPSDNEIKVMGYGLRGSKDKEDLDKATVSNKDLDIPGSPLFIVDGRELKVGESLKVDPDMIKSISVLKDASNLAHYGEKGKDGVIIIKTKEAQNKPLIVIDGEVKRGMGVQNLDPHKVQSISVLKDGSSLELYGDEGANGVILITTKSDEK